MYDSILRSCKTIEFQGGELESMAIVGFSRASVYVLTKYSEPAPLSKFDLLLNAGSIICTMLHQDIAIRSLSVISPNFLSWIS